MSGLELKAYYCGCNSEVFAKGVDKKMQQVCHYPVTSLLKSSMMLGPGEVTGSAQGLKWPKDPEETADIFRIARLRANKPAAH